MAELTELEHMRINAAATVANGRMMRSMGVTPLNANNVSTLGTGWTYDEDGNVIDPVDGYWLVGMAVGSAPIKP